MVKGNVFPAELRTFRDEVTGALIHQLTDHLCHSNHLYFTHSPYYASGTKMLFHSDRGNSRNLYELDLTNFQIRQLTEYGPDEPGVEPFAACINPVRDEAFFWVGRMLKAIDLATLEERELWEMPEGVRCLTPNCSADGAYVYFAVNPIITEGLHIDRLTNQPFSRDYCQAKPHCSIKRIPTDGGDVETIWEEGCWLGHVNTSPNDPHLLTFCHEGPWAMIDQRIWGLNPTRGTVWKIRPQNKGEIIGHEYWFADGTRVGYHGRDAKGRFIWGHADPTGAGFVDCMLPRNSTHFHSLDASLVVGDGSVLDPYLMLWHWTGEGYEGRLLVQHRCSFHVQKLHCHPAIVPHWVRFGFDQEKAATAHKRPRYVMFTADIGPYGNIFVVEIPQLESLPPVSET